MIKQLLKSWSSVDVAILSGIVLLFSSSVMAASLVDYSDKTLNDIGEEELSFKITTENHPVMKLTLPRSQVDAASWQDAGRLHLDWRGCRTKEMLVGTGDLSQCLRRAFLSVQGEADRLYPATLDLSVLQDGRLAVAYVPDNEPGLQFIADTTKAGAFWKTYVAHLDHAKLTPLAAATEEHAAEVKARRQLQGTEFVFFGDGGTGDSNQYAVASGLADYCRSERCDFGLMLGDNFYKDGIHGSRDSQWQRKFEKPYGALAFDFFPVLGNHDHYGNIQAQIDFSLRSKQWHMPGRYYDFERGDVAFFGIDSDDFDERQAEWLSKRLAASTKTWKIVFGHHPVYSYGRHGDTDALIEDLLPILVKHHVDFYLCGHDHDKQVIERDGIHFLLTGSGGAGLRPVVKGPYSAFASSTFGFSHLAIDGATAVFQELDVKGGVQFERTYEKYDARSKASH